MRTNAYLISVYSGLESKARRKLTPEKMFKFKQTTYEKSDPDWVKQTVARMMNVRQKRLKNAG